MDLGERVAVLEQQMRDVNERYNRDVTEIKGSLEKLLTSFNQMTGGRKAWFALASILGALIGVIATLVSLFLGGHH